MRFWQVFFFSGLSLLLSSCAARLSPEGLHDLDRYAALTLFSSAKQDVYQQFGQPHEVEHVPVTRASRWYYYDIAVRVNPATAVPGYGALSGGANINVTVASFSFNEEGILTENNLTRQHGFRHTTTILGDQMTPSKQARIVEREMRKLGLPFDEKLARHAASYVDSFAR